jgi:hypothetical protein
MSDFEERVRALFANGPDTPVRTVWRDGIEYVEVPMADLRNAMDPDSSETRDDQMVRHLAAVFGSTLEQHIDSIEYRVSKLPADDPRVQELAAQWEMLNKALAFRTKREEEAL